MLARFAVAKRCGAQTRGPKPSDLIGIHPPPNKLFPDWHPEPDRLARRDDAESDTGLVPEPST